MKESLAGYKDVFAALLEQQQANLEKEKELLINIKLWNRTGPDGKRKATVGEEELKKEAYLASLVDGCKKKVKALELLLAEL